MSTLPAISVAEQLAERILALDVPAAVREKCIDLAVDVLGLCITARNEDYVRATLAGCDDDGPCTAIGHARTLSAAAAALVNGTAPPALKVRAWPNAVHGPSSSQAASVART